MISDVNALDFPGDAFDVVRAHQVLQHVADPIRTRCRPAPAVVGSARGLRRHHAHWHHVVLRDARDPRVVGRNVGGPGFSLSPGPPAGGFGPGDAQSRRNLLGVGERAAAADRWLAIPIRRNPLPDIAVAGIVLTYFQDLALVPGATGKPPHSISKAWAARNTVASSNRLPTIIIPTGSPSTRPAGTEIAG